MKRCLVLLVASLLAGPLTGCSKPDPEYQAACEGPPLRTVERRNKALEDGNKINLRFDCIDKAALVAAAEEKARWDAANTPEALAQRKAEREKLIADEQARRAEARQAGPADSAAPAFVLRPVDVNLASETELASVPPVGPRTAAQIVAERSKARFKDWDDLVHRVVGLSAAEPAVFASICGLNVDGQTLAGAAPNPVMAAQIDARYQRLRAR